MRNLQRDDKLSNPKYKTPLNTNFIATYSHMIGGFLGGVTSTFSLHPLEVLKVRLAVDDGATSYYRYKNISNAVQSVYRTSGLIGFYQGVTPNLIGSSLSWGLYLYFYNQLKQSVIQHKHLSTTGDLRIAERAACASLSAFVTLTLSNPIWVVKTRMILQHNNSNGVNNRSYKGLFDGLRQIAREEGIGGFYRGYWAGVLGVSHGVVQLVIYEQLKIMYSLKTYGYYQDTAKLPTLVYLITAAVSKVIAVTVTFPYQVVRFRMQSRESQYTHLVKSFKVIWRNEGIHGFYKGLLPSILRVTPATCITFLVYEYFIICCNSIST